jgi:hypothetical protein
MPKTKNELLAPLQIIRTETVLSKLPIHNLSKKKKASIQITKKNGLGQIELYWKISHNSEYGPPGELAYKLDTLVINRRIDESGRPIPEMICLGSQNGICQELGVCTNSKNTTNVKKALRQNAFTAITAKLSYKGNDGRERCLEADFTRYSVIFTGERFPDGKKADAVYIIPNEPYREVLNSVPVRPLNYSYLKELTPMAQRFYEIISYRIFAAFKYHHSQAKLLYSDYCTFSAQQHYYDYEHFKKQMYKVHKPHLTSGYIEKVEYQETMDDNGQLDWVMCYTPGPKAKAEYRAFNSRQLFEGEVLDIEKEKPRKETRKERQRKERAPDTEARQRTGDALQLVQYFHKLARGIEDYQPYRGSKEESQASALLTAYGVERAHFIVDFAVAEARKTNFPMRTFGAVLQYVNEAVVSCERQEKEQKRGRAQEEAERQKAEQYADTRLQSLSEKQYRTLHEKAKKQILRDIPSLAGSIEGGALQSIIKAEMVRILAGREKNKTSI